MHKDCHKKAVYPGTFDPLTNGHIDIAHRAAGVFDEVVIAVSTNSAKTPLFTLDERLHMIRTIFKDDDNITVKTFTGLTVDYAASEGAIALVRGLRAVSDFEYELQIASMNYELNKNVETMFFMASEINLFTSSSMIKEIARLNGDISTKVPSIVVEMLKEKFKL